MMHYYKRNLGDYAKKAGRLSMLQHGAYTLLIDACYDREQFPTMEDAIEWSWASSHAEIEAVEFVLRKFFVFENGVYVQSRIKEEIDEYHSKAEINKRIAIQRETNRREKITNRSRLVEKTQPNQEPVTNNHSKEPYCPDFERAWKIYPSRPGANKKKSFAAWNARIKSGAVVEQMIAGVQRYAEYCRVQATEPRYIKQPQTFFGPDEHYLSDWTPQIGQQKQSFGKQAARDNYAAEAAAAREKQKGVGNERDITGECTVIR